MDGSPGILPAQPTQHAASNNAAPPTTPTRTRRSGRPAGQAHTPVSQSPSAGPPVSAFPKLPSIDSSPRRRAARERDWDRDRDRQHHLQSSQHEKAPQHQPPDRPRTATTRRRARTTSSATASSSAASGHSFTVANFNRGIIYLRPVTRAGHQRYAPPLPPLPLHPHDSFIFPPKTPPDSAALEPRRRASHETDARTAHTTLQRIVGSDDAPREHPTANINLSPRRNPAHTRSRSFSTLDAHTIATSQGTEPGTFRVIIERPPPAGRPKTADTGSLPLLEVPIPHYRLGTPRFSAHGTPILRSSVYTRASGTDDFRSSVLSPQRAAHSFLSSHPRSDVYSPPPISYRTTMDHRVGQSVSVPASARVSRAPIGPQLYDALTVNPEDSGLVRFSPSGDILAATPSRLVAHITSPSFLDYELLSDFFLTFRSFLTARELTAYLLSRLEWAVNRQDDFGRIVRVRTFVALRHWILNYFVDDFFPLYSLRVYFCSLVNALYEHLKTRPDGGGGDIKIVGELKKCWRRTCALYWDSEEAIGRDMADEELLPGGPAGSEPSVRDSTHNFRDSLYQPPRPTTPPPQADRSARVETVGSNPSDHFATGRMDWARQIRHTPQNSLSSPYVPSYESEGIRPPLSPQSERSIQVLSCSIPMRGLHREEHQHDMPLYPHPVPNPNLTSPRFVASSQHTGGPKRPNRPSHSHKRSGSFSDALRDNRAPLSIPKNPAVDARVSAISKMPGSLIRGAIFQPSAPQVELRSGGLRHTISQRDLDLADPTASDVQLRHGHSPNPGVKKIFGSVRRALSTKQPSASSPHVHSSHFQQQYVPPTRSSNPASLSTTSGGVHKRRHARPRPQARVDVLAARVADSFREATEQQSQNERQPAVKPDLAGFEFGFDRKGTPITEERSTPSQEPDPQRAYSAITAGSKSIVIMDDTGPPELPLMSWALPSPPAESNNAATSTRNVHQHSLSIDERLNEDPRLSSRQSALNQDAGDANPTDLQRMSRDPMRRHGGGKRRSLSEGREQLHSFRRRGSTKASLARTSSLRRHASHNSGLSRQNTTGSIATFQTMSSDNDPFFLDRSPKAPAPARQLRRRPGGDLRAVDNVQDLEHVQRPHSTGSVSNRTHSITNSIILRSDRFGDLSHDSHEVHSSSDTQNKKPISLVAYNSVPHLRPSLEAEVAKLAALPDDTDDDGGVESALLKLEGRYEKKSPDPSPRATVVPEVNQPEPSPTGSAHTFTLPSGEPSQQYNPRSHSDDALHRPLAPPETDGQGMYRLSRENFDRLVPTSGVESENSFSSIPLLDRGISDITASATAGATQSSARVAPLQPKGPTAWYDNPAPAGAASPNSSVEYVIETDSMKRIPRGGTVPNSSVPRESFLLDDDEDLTDDGNSVMVPRSESTSHGVRSFFDDEPAVLDYEKDALPMHPLRHPPTPPLTGNRLNGQSPTGTTAQFGPSLPTPGITPTSRFNNQPFGEPSQAVERAADPPIELQELKRADAERPPTHLPFVLAYDSETLAQQFTIVEKDALDEIDWKELIDLRWKQSSPQIRDWVEYLRTQDARGVDVVIARFNLVVKWTVSECLLTEAIEERARCFVKYIHIAAHARRLRNYATMYQITIALLSADISRLKQTWALVPAAELRTMRSLEALVQPLRNFHNLRVEMETASVEDGCIPFIGIYTRDLIYNAQKPAFIDAPPADGERLVNFERHHTAAMIVKSLLRLLEASSRYNFKAEPNVISKCLWLAALRDEELTALSRRYE